MFRQKVFCIEKSVDLNHLIYYNSSETDSSSNSNDEESSQSAVEVEKADFESPMHQSQQFNFQNNNQVQVNNLNDSDSRLIRPQSDAEHTVREELKQQPQFMESRSQLSIQIPPHR